MPQWSSEGDVAVLRTIEAGAALPPPELPAVGEVFEKSAFGVGIVDRIKEAAERAKARQRTAGETLQVDTLGAAAGLRLGPGVGFAEDRLDKARDLIKKEKYKEALQILGDFLNGTPGHPTALYLKGLCQFRLDTPEDALRTIAPLIPRTPAALDSQLRQLRVDIREKMSPEVVTTAFAMTLLGQASAAAHMLGDLLGLDPEVPLYHCLRAHLLIETGDLFGARAAVEAATPYCQGADRETLDMLRGVVLQRLLEMALEPARQHYRKLQNPFMQKFDRAFSVLKNRSTPLDLLEAIRHGRDRDGREASPRPVVWSTGERWREQGHAGG